MSTVLLFILTIFITTSHVRHSKTPDFLNTSPKAQTQREDCYSKGKFIMGYNTGCNLLLVGAVQQAYRQDLLPLELADAKIVLHFKTICW